MNDRDSKTLKQIACIRNDFTENFGIPRQSGLAEEFKSIIVFEPEFAVKEAFRGLEDFSHLWLIWGFSENKNNKWSPTVRPPRLGGNTRMGVFATRSPYRPNALGLSCVRIVSIKLSGPESPQIEVAGADLLDGTPIYDIKPYLAFTDSRPNARGGFADLHKDYRLQVVIPETISSYFPEDKLPSLLEFLANDPRPAYHKDPDRIYGLSFAECNILFTVIDDTLTVTEITSSKSSNY